MTINDKRSYAAIRCAGYAPLAWSVAGLGAGGAPAYFQYGLKSLAARMPSSECPAVTSSWMTFVLVVVAMALVFTQPPVAGGGAFARGARNDHHSSAAPVRLKVQ